MDFWTEQKLLNSSEVKLIRGSQHLAGKLSVFDLKCPRCVNSNFQFPEMFLQFNLIMYCAAINKVTDQMVLFSRLNQFSIFT